MLFGASPLRSHTAAELGLQPAMSFETRLISVKAVAKGQRVGYGGHWVAPRNSVLGIAAAGYADGYPWHVGSGTRVGIGKCIRHTGWPGFDGHDQHRSHRCAGGSHR